MAVTPIDSNKINELPQWKVDAIVDEWEKPRARVTRKSVKDFLTKHEITSGELIGMLRAKGVLKKPLPPQTLVKPRDDDRDFELSLQTWLLGYDPSGEGHEGYDPASGEYFDPNNDGDNPRR